MNSIMTVVILTQILRSAPQQAHPENFIHVNRVLPNSQK